MAFPAQAGSQYLESPPRPQTYSCKQAQGLPARDQRAETWGDQRSPRKNVDEGYVLPSQLRPLVFIEFVIFD